MAYEINPFSTPPYLSSADKLYDRQKQLLELRAKLDARANLVLFGPEGIGKSALLECFFNRRFLLEQARDLTLIYLGAFPDNMDGEGVYGFFGDKLREITLLLSQCGMADLRQSILEEMDKQKHQNMASRFDGYLNTLITYGCRVVFVLDNFERFTSSPRIKEEHHDLLCGVLNANKLQLLVATNYDFDKSSLPEGTHNSTLLSRLKPGAIEVEPMDAASCRQLLEDAAQRMQQPFPFTDEQMEVIYNLSGGVPKFLWTVAKCAFDARKADDWEQALEDSAFEETSVYMKRWCKFITREQKELLHTLREGTQLYLQEEDALAKVLKDRGLFVESIHYRQDGTRMSTSGYRYNCGLFRIFCRDDQLLQKLVDENPLRPKQEVSQQVNLSALMGGYAATGGFTPPAPAPAAPVNHTTVVVQPGATVNVNQNTQYVNVSTPLNFGQLFDTLQLTGDHLKNRLLDIFDSAGQKSLPATLDREEEVEQQAEKIVTMFVPEEVETTPLVELREEQKTLDARFRKIRANVDPTGQLSDELLDSLSAKCSLYLKIAFVVDDALSALDDFKLGDLSARMVMYGKVLEQQLKDTMYPLFQSDARLGAFVCKRTANGNEKLFSGLTVNETSIGNYTTIMAKELQYLANLAKQEKITYGQEKAERSFWSGLQANVDKARELRNEGDHSGSETTAKELEKMRNLLYGDKAVLDRCFVADRLHKKLQQKAAQAQAAAAAQQKANANEVKNHPMLGKSVTLSDVTETEDRGITGKVAILGYKVVVSAADLAKKKRSASDYVGKKPKVWLNRCYKIDGAEVFMAELD